MNVDTQFFAIARCASLQMLNLVLIQKVLVVLQLGMASSLWKIFLNVQTDNIRASFHK